MISKKQGESYILAAFGLEKVPPFASAEVRQGIDWIKQTFAERLQWTPDKALRFSFRVLMEASRPGEMAFVKMRGTRDYVLELNSEFGSEFLDSVLKEAEGISHNRRKEFFKEALMPKIKEVDQVLQSVKIRFSEEELSWLKALVSKHGFSLTTLDGRSGNLQLGAAILKLLKEAYDHSLE